MQEVFGLAKETEGDGSDAPGGISKDTIIVGLLVAALLVSAFTQFQIGRVSELLGGIAIVQQGAYAGGQTAAWGAGGQAAASGQGSPSSAGAPALAGAGGTSVDLKALEAQVFPRGVPNVYGAELGISYDNPVPAISLLAAYDDGSPMQDAALNARYVEIGMQISCEYCCGVDTIIFPNGQAACGCAHSYAMRGLAKYMLAKHPEVSNEQVLEEMGKWKILFFPKDQMAKAVQFSLAGKDINPTDLTSNQYRGFSAQSEGSAGGLDSYAGQVGGC